MIPEKVLQVLDLFELRSVVRDASFLWVGDIFDVEMVRLQELEVVVCRLFTDVETQAGWMEFACCLKK